MLCCISGLIIAIIHSTMARALSFGLFLLLGSKITLAQPQYPSRLKVFFDCSSAWCDIQYIRTEINVVDFLLDNEAADVHVLVTSQNTGGGGTQYQLIFFGQQLFKNQKDTLRYSTNPNATDFENRDIMLRYVKSGLIPFIIKTASAKDIELSLKRKDSVPGGSADSSMLNDPWNAWVLRVGADGSISADANYRSVNYVGNFSANRITEKTKTGIGVNWGKNKSVFEYEDNGTTEQFQVDNHQLSANHYFVKSISDHWSWAYELRYSQNTFSNNKGRFFVRPAIEYNVFPYKEVNNKLFTLSYALTGRLNHYYDSTIYNKKREALFGHRAIAYLTLNQKWGNAFTAVSYHTYFNNFRFFNLGIESYVSVRITGGLSFYVVVSGGLTRDQVFLVKGSASPEEVLARRRQLASGFNYYSSTGIQYRFGSKLNNVINPRFDRSIFSNED